MGVQVHLDIQTSPPYSQKDVKKIAALRAAIIFYFSGKMTIFLRPWKLQIRGLFQIFHRNLRPVFEIRWSESINCNDCAVCNWIRFSMDDTNSLVNRIPHKNWLYSSNSEMNSRERPAWQLAIDSPIYKTMRLCACLGVRVRRTETHYFMPEVLRWSNPVWVKFALNRVSVCAQAYALNIPLVYVLLHTLDLRLWFKLVWS